MAYTVGSLYTLLPRLGIRLKTPRPRHTQADPSIQAGRTRRLGEFPVEPTMTEALASSEASLGRAGFRQPHDPNRQWILWQARLYSRR